MTPGQRSGRGPGTTRATEDGFVQCPQSTTVVPRGVSPFWQGAERIGRASDVRTLTPRGD